MKCVAAATAIAAILLAGSAAARDQRGTEKTSAKEGREAVPEEDRAARLEEARQAVEARLARGRLTRATVTATDVKRIRRITIDVPPMSKNPRDDASTALSAAWQPGLQFVTAFDEIAVRVGAGYLVTCGSRAFADTSISLWGDGLARTCRERRS